MTRVIVVIGPGSIGQAIARRVSAGKRVLLADLRQEHADAAARTLRDAGFEVDGDDRRRLRRASVQALVRKARALATSRPGSTPPASRRPRPRRRPS